ncbi:oxidoreductase [Verticillium alfalfae VaMs.102]|uniref:Oxidoreductase n=1 Tax=Verticillium alfalfae (strain VaMs.102 / ATCC MYA-4576 / FGSC 10136) TaxID=526221 RepID=C9S8R4_VERA1|nr:oxidoreductase [Verticillium alfalfae VaMs.102]EEY15364.1 oxidoreductase [Verticillium alfalfae VaMs.102]
MASPNKPTVLITGASQGGSGNALALEFAKKGYRVFATARSLRTLTNLTENGIETLTVDVTDFESLVSLRDEIAGRTGGKLDILFNNAGTLYEAPAIEQDPVRVKKMFETNVFGLFDSVSVFTPLLLKAAASSSRAPTIVNVASILARIPMPFTASYNATKAAVASYSDTLRLELEPLGIRVVTLYMGEVSTGLMSTENVDYGPDSIYADLEPKAKERTANHTKTSVTPKEFATGVVSQVVGSNSNYIWKGTNAFLCWLLNAFAPHKSFDSSLKDSVGLSDKELVSKVLKRGQKLISKD